MTKNASFDPGISAGLNDLAECSSDPDFVEYHGRSANHYEGGAGGLRSHSRSRLFSGKAAIASAITLSPSSSPRNYESLTRCCRSFVLVNLLSSCSSSRVPLSQTSVQATKFSRSDIAASSLGVQLLLNFAVQSKFKGNLSK
jgi:hypothetical protein